MQRIVDLTHPLDEATPVYPGDPPLEVSVLETTRDVRPERRALNSSRVSLGMHCGTHMDAPFHFFDEGHPIDRVPLERLVGPALLIDLRSTSAGGSIETAHLEAHRARLEQVRRAVLFTGWSRQWGRPEYFSDHPVMSGEAAELLVACGGAVGGRGHAFGGPAAVSSPHCLARQGRDHRGELDKLGGAGCQHISPGGDSAQADGPGGLAGSRHCLGSLRSCDAEHSAI